MVQSLQVLDFSIGLLRIRRVPKGLVDLLQGTDRPCFLVSRLPHLTICALTHLLDDFKGPQHLGIDGIEHFLLHASNKNNYQSSRKSLFFKWSFIMKGWKIISMHDHCSVPDSMNSERLTYGY